MKSPVPASNLKLNSVAIELKQKMRKIRETETYQVLPVHCHQESGASALREHDARRWGLCPRTGILQSGTLVPGYEERYIFDICGTEERIHQKREEGERCRNNKRW